MHNLIGKKVVVETYETTYTGTLIEVGDEEVHLQSDFGWVVVPIDRITDIKEKE